YLGAAEFAMMAALDLAAQLGGHRLLAIANSKDWNACFINCLRCERRVFVEHGCRPTRENDGLRPHFAECSFRLLVRNDLGIDLLLPDPARNELGHLGTEIDDQNLVVHGRPMWPERVRNRGAKAVRGRFLRALYRRVKPFGASSNAMLAPNVLRNWVPIRFCKFGSRHGLRN